MKIGVFDSGVGGLTVVKEIRKQVPTADMIYVGDSQHVPYGTKTKAQLSEYVENIVSFLEEEEADVIVFACNTASSLLLKEMQKRHETPLMGMIEAGAEMAKEVAEKGIAVIATTNTIQSRAYECALTEKGTHLPVTGWACDELVQVVETHMNGSAVDEKTVAESLGRWDAEGCDTLVLGCTHFPLIEPVIASIIGKNVSIVNPAIEVAKRVAEGERMREGKGTLRLYTSGDDTVFSQQASSVLGKEVKVALFHHKKKASEV